MKTENNELELGAVRAIAAASSTPFKTAFKVTMGIMVAQLAITVLFVCGLAGVFTLIYLLSR